MIGVTERTFAQNAFVLDHIAIAVENHEESISWYTKQLGFLLADRMEVQGESNG